LVALALASLARAFMAARSSAVKFLVLSVMAPS